MVIDDRRLDPGGNNLTLVRLVLASAVIWTHSIWQLTGQMSTDEIAPFAGVPLSSMAVDGFFFLSGFLVYASLLRRGSVKDFALARLARLWPGLAVSVLLVVAAGFALSTAASPIAYLHGATARFVASNLTFLGGSYALTGVTCGSEPCTVNGSLWTIPWEVRCYALLGGLFVIGLARPAVMKRVVLPASLLFAIVMSVPAVQRAIVLHAGSGAVYYLSMLDRLWSMFALGIAAYLWRGRIRLRWSWLLIAVLVWLATERWAPVPHLRGLVIGYALLCGGFLSARRRAISARWPDYSYGIYIYAFPVMVGLAHLIRFTAHPPLALATLAVTVPLAALSWHLVEKPALQLVHSRRRARRGAQGPDRARPATADAG